MLTIVLICNILITLTCLFLAWRVWQLQHTLAKVTDTLISVEKSAYAILHGAPHAIIKGQQGVYQLRQQHQKLKPQLHQLRQVLALVSLGQTIWQRRSPLRRRSSSTRSRSAKRF